jgi:V8-like Glu-specific endopeptidase
MINLRCAVLCIFAALPEQAHCFPARISAQPFLQPVNVFSDDPQTPHDPRHAQPQTGADKMFAPIGLITTDQPVPNEDGSSYRHAGTAFLVSPCYVLTAYHVVLGTRKTRPDADQDHAATFRVAGERARAVPVKYGEVYRFPGRDWVLLRLDSDADHSCLGENIGWTELTPLNTAEAKERIVSIASYPQDKAASILWRQNACRLYEKSTNINDDGMWTTDCATLPRASGSPIFFVENGALHVVAIMIGHLGAETNDVLPQWDPARANRALDIGKIFSSDPDAIALVNNDIARFGHPNPAQVPEP